MLKTILVSCLGLLLIRCQTNSVSTTPVESQAFYKMNIIRIALEQSEQPSINWEPQQRDCAGFVRFVYRNAINTKEPLWYAWDGTQKIPYANAELLVAKNFSKISDSISDVIQTGDILVFRRAGQKKEDEWHLMLLMESPWEQKKWLVTYHNGARSEAGGVKKIWMQDLLDVDGLDWKPTGENKNFVGVYRWNAWVK
ncbi:MAG: DUF1175 family protein [Bdellovibrionaceae bacterium]|nr:DUF1175 family protein [Pseudobdellovibrionaceae bacterium]